ncbi:DHA2 family efflux MFS transporter permease subunit [Conexibacter sp. CPCC 206217]|uniref:DHA2 family efflux MFS transporter permease subunit n=1 Tax=Conexibacter sp. CPCC 206217 TaxID=3064574 RepID=UPI00271DC99E|nr:DHA2 family efflux MFS transporter permease subunit [Conexibacter sp. CPCC 206217]MDO8213825.1 DHA2 family efflux MFS transporter permease subunit [Conexibacter sp. CPCC 206217]
MGKLRITEENRRWWILITMTGSLSMILIDQTVVSVALPTMQRDLGLSTTGVQWVVNAYLLAIAVFVALGGRAGDILGNVRVFRVGALTFVLASAACGFAQSETWIIVARAIQGIGAAMMTPASGAIVINSFGPRERGRAMGVYAGVSMIFLALGPLIGGLLVQGVTWRAVFFVNLPVGLVMLVLAQTTLRPDRPQGGSVDWVAAPLIVFGIGSLVLALMQSRTWGWGSPQTVGLLIAAALLIPATILWELRQTAPLVQLRLFANHNFTADNTVLAAVQFGLTGVSVFGAIWVQDVLGFGPIEAGLSLLPLTLPLLVIAPRSGALYDRIGPRLPVATGAGLVAIALIWNAAAMSKLSYPWIVPGYLLMGIGLALVMGPANTDAMNAAPAALRGQASGVIQTMRQVGATLGIALMGTVVANVQLSQVQDVIAQQRVPAADVSQLEAALNSSGGAAGSGGPSAADIPPALAHDLREAATTATSSAYYVAAGVLLLATVLAALMLRRQRAADADGDDASAYAAVG